MFSKFSIGVRLGFGFGLLLLFLILTNVSSVFRMQDMAADINGLVDDRLVALEAAHRSNEYTIAAGRALRGLLLSDNNSERKALINEVGSLRSDNKNSLSTLDSKTNSEVGIELLEKIKKIREIAGSQYAEFFNLVESKPDAARVYLKGTLTPTMNDLIFATNQMIVYQQEEMHLLVKKNRHAFNNGIWFSSVSLLVATIFTIIVSVFITRSIVAPLTMMQSCIKTVCDNFDFTQAIPVHGESETDTTAKSFNRLITDLRGTLGSIIEAATEINVAASDLAKSSRSSARSSDDASDSAASMAAVVEQFSVSISHISDNANEVLSTVRYAGHLSENGERINDQALNEMRSIASAVKLVSSQIDMLGVQSNQISSIVQVIKDVADQTNLLALNAAIEAARAGESGRGFAVVADEVRKLAERTANATGEIAEMINSIQSSATQAVKSMDTVVARVSVGMEFAEQTNSSITEIRDSSLHIVTTFNEISDALIEQGSASQAIAQQVERVALSSEENNGAAQATAKSADKLREIVLIMQRQTEKFII